MDVNLTISLIRGQMGVVIEKAVTVAVETVLGEMMKVVSIKFDEFRKEINAKDKETENIRQMLEISRCQMRAMRKYLSVSTAKDDRQSHTLQRQQANQFDSVRVPDVYLDQSTFSQPLPQGGISNGLLCRRTMNNQTQPELRNSSNTHKSLVSREEPNTTSHKTKDPVSTEDPAPPNDRLIASDGTLSLTPIKQEITDPPELDCGLQGAGEGLDVPHSQELDQPGSPERGLPDAGLDPGCHLNPGEAEEDTSAPPLSRPSPVVKEEEEEMTETVPIKQEPVEVEVEVEGDSLALGPAEGEGLGQAGYLEGTGTQQITAGTSVGQTSAYYAPLASSSTYASTQPCRSMVTSVSRASTSGPGSSLASATGVGSEVAAAAAARQARPWLRDLGLYEQYKQARSELRRRSQMRRKQLEQDLPQALLADLVKERREKTRLRVARWRAKRKLQACLMGAPQSANAAVMATTTAATTQAGQSMQRAAAAAAGLHMQQAQRQTGIPMQQQRLSGRPQHQQSVQQHQHQHQQGRTGLHYGGRVGRAFTFGAGSPQGLPSVSAAVSGSTGSSHTLSSQAFNTRVRFVPQRTTTYVQHITPGVDTEMYQ
ncbi:uncharacterized protein si:ch211-67e16.4 [Alosa sapidissima]|uniref:uncharacterized protein si:ch211-67e16.4 n=1 Tax=Alosa sapidissima TaxID=34773 RepID=UPI001C0A3375|nr:uncharacterized protein si:ch211-67e16.4 [Alosa sapidissima]